MEFPFCSECDFVAATPKQFQKHVLEHERVWWRATMESFFMWAEEQESTTGINLYIPFFEEYLKIIGPLGREVHKNFQIKFLSVCNDKIILIKYLKN